MKKLAWLTAIVLTIAAGILALRLLCEHFKKDASRPGSGEVKAGAKIKPHGGEMIAPDSYPELHITSVTKPHDRSKPLEISFSLAAVGGSTPVAVSQEQFSIHIMTPERLSEFEGNALFPSDAPRIFTVLPSRPLALSATTLTDRFNSRGWSSLPPGRYTVRVYINSDKQRQFDYQWLGQNYSDDYPFDIQCVPAEPTVRKRPANHTR
jgi:hypothetical protein